MSIITCFFLFFGTFLSDFIIAHLQRSFSLHLVRLLFYFKIIRHHSMSCIIMGGLFVLLESFVLYGIIGVDLLIMIPLAATLYALKDTFDNHWILQLLLALMCYCLHTYGLRLLLSINF